jgi:hypothetical protein
VTRDEEFELFKLRFIRERYGARIQASAARHGHRPEVVAGIMMRETEGGLSKWCNPSGPACLGDNGHGHGLMQIDDRSFPAYCAGSDWKDPASNIEFGCRVLAEKRSYLRSHLPNGSKLSNDELERAAIAAYNCGEGNVCQAIVRGEGLDSRTAGHDYSRSVLAFADTYRELNDPIPETQPEPQPSPVPAPAPVPEQQAAAGFWGTLFGLLMKIFVKRTNPA